MDFDAPAATVSSLVAKDPKINTDAAPSELEQKTAEPKILSVSALNKAVKSMLEGEFRQIWLQGEISNFKPHSSGHFYFNLKDSKAMVSAVMFRGSNQGLKFKPNDGLEVIVRGNISVYEPRGSYQIICETMEPVGAGALQLAFEQLKKKLQLEGLFDAAKKRPLPAMPRHLAVVTSPTGAAIRDILNILGRRFAGLRVTVVPAIVQGDKAPDSICAAIALAQKLTDVDVMIVGRGGGSIEDMWGFNDERVARAIAAARIPVISAVGHEIDFTIADFVADLRAPTPSAAAELVCKNAAEITEGINLLKKRLWRSWSHRLQIARQSMQHATARLVDPKRRLQDLSLRCDELSQRLEAAIARYFHRREQQVHLAVSRLASPREVILRLGQEVKMMRTRIEAHLVRSLEAKRSRWAQLSSVLDSLSPLKVVERGYSITYKNSKPVKSVEQLATGDLLEITFAKGKAAARVEKILEP
ncbi:MAG: exodeoxyribonuclease VII large subunit [Bdellovibrionales bacterium]